MNYISALQRIAVIGSGKMGNDIFYFLLPKGYGLTWVCIDDKEAEKQQLLLHKKIQRQLKNGIITHKEQELILSNTIITHNYETLDKCNLIIECVSEKLSVKQLVFEQIAKVINNETCIIGSNSSSIIPSKICTHTQFHNRVVGIHFFYPVMFKNIVEIIITENTSLWVMQSLIDFCSKIGKRYLLLNENNAFILNKLFLDVQNEAYRLAKEKNIEFAAIDTITSNYLFPGGIFNVIDQIGIDVMYESVKNYVETYAEKEKYSDFLNVLKNMVSEGFLGTKNGKGFYDYSLNQKNQTINIPDDLAREIINSLFNVYQKKASSIVEANICSKDELDFAIKEYTGGDKTPEELSATILKT